MVLTMTQILDNPSEYGFTNTDTACFNPPDFCALAQSVAPCSPASQYMWWDTVHPTTRVHEAIAHKILQGVYDLLMQARRNST